MLNEPGCRQRQWFWQPNLAGKEPPINDRIKFKQLLKALNRITNHLNKQLNPDKNKNYGRTCLYLHST